jgi:DNA polymerase epsilon subunit 2
MLSLQGSPFTRKHFTRSNASRSIREINYDKIPQLITANLSRICQVSIISMNRPNQPAKPRAAPIFRPPSTPVPLNPIPSSSPAFATPAHPIRPFNVSVPLAKPSILPILLPPATLRPLAFRTFTKKHSLTLTSSALQVLATFIGRHCGTEWREEGLAERVLEEVAKSWKSRGGGVIVDGDGNEMKDILKNLEGSMSGGRIAANRELSRQNSLILRAPQDGELSEVRSGVRPNLLGRKDSQSSLGMSASEMEDEGEGEGLKDPRRWLKVIDAFEQPRLVYNVGKKHFDRFVVKRHHLFYTFTNLKFPETQHDHHYFLHHHTKLKYSAIGTI